MTNDRCTRPGVYRSLCPDRVEIRLEEGRPFPRCPTCGRAVFWHHTDDPDPLQAHRRR